MEKIKKYWWLGVIVAAVVIFKILETAWSSLTNKNPEHGEKVNVVAIIDQEVTVEKEYIGFVKPVNDVVVQPYISGFISRVNISGGQEVKVNDNLVLIDAAEYVAVLDKAKADVAKANADYVNAKDYYERIEKAGVRAISQTEINNAKADFLSAEALLKQAEAVEQQAEINLGYTIIEAPIDGVVGSVPLTAGDYVSPQSELMRIVQITPMRVVFSITDKDYLEELKKSKMFEDEKVKIRLADGTIYEKFGEFKYVDNAIDRTTNSIAVFFDFENQQRKLVDNAYVTVLVEKKYRGVVWPKDMVTLQADGSFVVVADGETVKRRKVKILNEYENNYILENDFKPEEKLVADKIILHGNEQKMAIVENNAKEQP